LGLADQVVVAPTEFWRKLSHDAERPELKLNASVDCPRLKGSGELTVVITGEEFGGGVER